MAELHPRTGKLVILSNGNRTATRKQPAQEFNQGLVLSARPLGPAEVFTVRLDRKMNSWSGSMEIGLTTQDPSLLDFPSSATGLKGGSWVVSGCSVLEDGRSILEEYGQDLDQLGEGDRVGIQRSLSGELHLWVNGRDCGSAAGGIPPGVWAVVDLYGKCTQITVLSCQQPEEEEEEELEESETGPPLSAGHPRPDKFPSSLDSDPGFPSTELSAVVSNAILSAYQGNLLSVSLGSPPPGAEHSPPTSNDALLFHEKCGTLIKLSNGNKTAERRRPLDEFNNGVVMTNRPLRDCETFEIRIDKLVDKWSGSIEIGVTTHNPNSLEYPATMTNLRSGTIMMSGCGILTNGKGTRREYCEFSLDELQEGDHIGLTRKSNGALHFYINGMDQGVASCQTPPVVYGVVDLYGMAVKVTIVHNHNHADRLRRNNAILRARSPDPGRQNSTTPDPGQLLFHSNCGQKASITNGGRTALRPHATDDFNHGVVLSNRPLHNNEVFQVRIDKMVDKWAGSIEIGVTTHNPAYLQLPSTMTNLRSGTWMMTGNGVMHNGTTILDEYGHNLDRLKAGDTVGVVRREDGTLNFFVNGVAQGVAAWNVPPNVFAVVDLYGQAAQATIVDEADSFPLAGEEEEVLALTPGTPCSQLTSDLRFHHLHGTNALITNGGRTALRNNSRSEFNDAIVMSSRPLRDGELFEIAIQKMVDRWSGSIEAGVTAIRPEDLEFPNTMTDIDYDTWMLSGTAIMQDGNTLRNNYGCDLDSLGAGSRIGMMKTTRGDLHYYINGEDQGVACTGLPGGRDIYAVIDLYGQCVQVSLTGGSGLIDNSLSASHVTDKSLPTPSPVPSVSHRFHSICGKNVSILCDGTRAERSATYGDAIVFSSSELLINEVFEVKVDGLEPHWSGSCHIGVTSIPPHEAPFLGGGLPPSAIELRTRVTWLVSGSEVLRNGQRLRENYCSNLQRIRTGCRLGVRRDSDDSLHIIINGEDMGPAASGIPKGVYAIFDLYGSVTALSVVSSSVLEESDATKPPSVTSESEEEDVDHNADPLPTLQLHHLHFMGNHGKNIQLSHDNRTATRVCSYNQGIVVLTQPLPRLFLFQVRIDQLSPRWTSSLSIGVIGVSPERLNFPATAAAIKKNAWIFQRSAVLFNGAKVREGYGPNLDLCPEGTCVGLLLDSSGGLHLYINGLDQGVGAQDLPDPCYVVVDLYGQCERVSIVTGEVQGAESSAQEGHIPGEREKADMVDGVKESLCWLPPDPLALLSCEYLALCLRFKELLLLPDGYFMEDSKLCVCHCESCHKLRGDETYSKRGDPPREYAEPTGWCSFPLRLSPRLSCTQYKKWHIAYQGSSAGNVRRTLDRGELLPGSSCILTSVPTKSDSQNGFPAPEPNVLQSFEVQSVVLSPTLRYAGLSDFCPKVQFRDPRSQRTFGVQVALQVCVRPGSYKMGPASAVTSDLSDPRIPSSEVEWLTKEKGATVLRGLLVRVE